MKNSKGIFLGPKILKSTDIDCSMYPPSFNKEFPPIEGTIVPSIEPTPIIERKIEPPPPAKINLGRQTPKIEQLPNGMYREAPGGNARATDDHTAFRHNRQRDVGFKIGNYIQTPPLLFTRDGHSIYLGDIYRGSSAFLIAGGPSFNKINKEKLNNAGFITFGLNNSAKSFRPDLWTCVDDPTHFIKSIWLDPKIMKFAPYAHADKKIFDNEKWQEMDMTVGDCPNVLYYRRNEIFNAEQYLFEDTINWGNHSKLGGGRAVILAAIRILFYLGIRKVFLLGVDFDMSAENKYSFEQSRSDQAIKNNNETYKMLIERFTQLKPIFEKYDFHVFNCNPESQLKVFDFVDFDEAVKIASKDMPEDLSKERTEGLYDRKATEKEKNKTISKIGNETKESIKQKLDDARQDLDDAKEKLQKTDKNSTDPKTYQELEQDVVRKRQVFRNTEKKKNLIWFGSEEKPKNE